MKIAAAEKLLKRIAAQDPTRGCIETVGQGPGQFVCRFCRESDGRVERIEHAPTCEWRQAREIVNAA